MKRKPTKMTVVLGRLLTIVGVLSLLGASACRKKSSDDSQDLAADPGNIVPVSGNTPTDGAPDVVVVTNENGEQTQSFGGILVWKSNGTSTLSIAKSVNEDEPLSVSAVATHQSLPITYNIKTSTSTCLGGAWSSEPAVSSVGVVSGVPTGSAVGTCLLVIEAKTFNATITATITVTVVGTDDPPEWNPTIGDLSVGDFQDINLTANADDPDAGQQITYKFDTSAMTCDDGDWNGLAINSVSGVISGQPTTADIGGSCTITVVATSGGVSITDTFTVTVTNVPTPPMWDSLISNQVVLVGAGISVTAAAVDNDPAESPAYSLDAASMSCDDGTWSGLSIDGSSGLVSGTPAVGDIGNCTIKVVATSNAETISQTFTVQVTNIIANDDSVTITEDDVGASGNAVANDVNVTSVVSANFGPSVYGVMSGNSDATWSYALNSTSVIQALNPAQTLVDTISYDFIDSLQGPAGADIIITIQGVNDDPFTSSNISYSLNKTQENVEFTIRAEDVDNGDTAQFTAASGATDNGYGTYSITTGGQFNFTLNRAHASVTPLLAGNSIADSVDLQITDTNGGSATVGVSLTIEGVNPGHDSNIIIYEEDPDSSAASAIADLTADPITNGVGSQNLGTFDLLSGGNWSYTLNNGHATVQALGEGESIDDVIAYTGVDGSLDPVAANLTATIKGVNDVPQLDSAIADVAVTAGVSETIDLSGATVTSSSGTAANAIDGNTLTITDTANATASAQWVQVAFVNSYEFEQVTIDFNGNIGNAVLQVINAQDVVVTREVLGANVSSSPHTVTFEPLVGAKIKILRPTGSSATNGDLDLKIKELTIEGSLTPTFSINGASNFSDADTSDTLTYSVSRSSGASAPNWLSVNSTTGLVEGLVPQDVNVDIVLKAQDQHGKFAVDTFNISRPADGGATNRAPVSLLQIQDEKRGGVTRIRYGGNAHFGSAADKLQGGTETAKFLFDPDQSGFWNIVTLDVEDKYLDNGEILPFVNAEREYGEKYQSFFVPALTGIYRFRTNGTVDDGVVLGVSTTEYAEDRIDVIISSSYFEPNIESEFGIDIVSGTEFGNGGSPAARAFGFDTGPFFDGSFNANDSTDGYIYLEKGNVHYFEIKFAEQGGAAVWSFEFDRRDKGSDPVAGWDGWKPLASSQMVPTDGADAYTPNVVPALGGVNYDASVLFYDAEQDTMSYSAKLVNADGTSFSGPISGTDQVSELGLSLNTATGLLTGTLDLGNYTTERIVFSATDPGGSAQTATGLMIKFDPTTAP